MDKKQTNIGSLKVGNYIIIDDIACTVKSIQSSKTGKHGHAKCRIEAIGIIDSQKKIIVAPSHDKVDVPIVIKKNAQILSIQDDTANVMDSETFETFDLNIPDELKDKVKENSEIIYWIILNDKIMKSLK